MINYTTKRRTISVYVTLEKEVDEHTAWMHWADFGDEDGAREGIQAAFRNGYLHAELRIVQDFSAQRIRKVGNYRPGD